VASGTIFERRSKRWIGGLRIGVVDSKRGRAGNGSLGGGAYAGVRLGPKKSTGKKEVTRCEVLLHSVHLAGCTGGIPR